MTALAQGKQIRPLADGHDDYAGQKGNTIVYAGGIVMLDASGYAKPGATATGCIAVGVAQTNRGIDRFDATATGPNGVLADGVGIVRWDEGIFPMGNSSSADAILATTQPGVPLWVVDDQTVALTNGGGTRSPAGRFHHLDADGVWVTMGKTIAAGLLQGVQDEEALVPVTVHCVLKAHSNGSIAARFTPGFAGIIKKMTAYVIDPATTAAKLATFTPAIGGTGTTGGAVALTSANCTPAGAKIDGLAVTALNSFLATDEVTIVASGVTAFVEGQVDLVLFLARAA